MKRFYLGSIMLILSIGVALAQPAKERISIVGYGGLAKDVLTTIVLDPFSTQFGVEIQYESGPLYAEALDAMSQFDLIIADDRILQKLARKGYLSSVDFKTVPNLADLNSRIRNLAPSYVPIGYTATGVAFNPTIFKVMGADAPISWSDLSNPAKNIRSIGFLHADYTDGAHALAALGSGSGRVQPAGISEVEAGLTLVKAASLHKDFRGYDPDALITSMGQGRIAAAAVGTDLVYKAVRQYDIRIQFVYPREGAVLHIYGVGWPRKDGGKSELTGKLVAKLLDPAVQRQLVERLYWVGDVLSSV